MGLGLGLGLGAFECHRDSECCTLRGTGCQGLHGRVREPGKIDDGRLGGSRG
jgi:hypothetical protein